MPERLLGLAREATEFWSKLNAAYFEKDTHFRRLDAKIGNLIIEYEDALGELGALVGEIDG